MHTLQRMGMIQAACPLRGVFYLNCILPTYCSAARASSVVSIINQLISENRPIELVQTENLLLSRLEKSISSHDHA